jgi:hypothetical protein
MLLVSGPTTIMGFYFRKGVRVGPVRFNLSKSGIGVSAGVRGLRIGAGPRGNYFHAGTNGFYYRASLPAGRTSPTPSPRLPDPASSASSGLTEIDSSSVLRMTDSSAGALLKELNDNHNRYRLWPSVLFVTFALGLTVLPSAAIGIGLALTALTAYWDRLRRTTVLLYDMEPDAQQRYQQLHDAFDQFAASGGIWHLEAEDRTQDRKRQAGASVVVRRKRVRLAKTPPAAIKTNIEAPTLPAGRQTLCFLPDRLLVFDRTGVGTVNYASLNIEAATSNFIESEQPPSDAKVIGHT